MLDNIKTLVGDWKKDGSIGASHPSTKTNAIRQAVAITLTSAGKSRKTQREPNECYGINQNSVEKALEYVDASNKKIREAEDAKQRTAI